MRIKKIIIYSLCMLSIANWFQQINASQALDPKEHMKPGKGGVYITRKNDVVFRSNSHKFIEARNLSSKLAGVRGTFTHK